MTGRQTTPRQEPLAPEVGFSELVTRMINANRVERAQRVKRNVARVTETADESPREMNDVPKPPLRSPNAP